jgi:hypothetical protein
MSADGQRRTARSVQEEDMSSYAGALFASARRTARVRQIWAKLRGQSRRLLDLTTVAAASAIGDRRAAGMQTIPIRQICGSEGRCDDFDMAFHALQTHTEDRWVSVARANLRGRGLPPVELVQIGEVFFVRDGRHRISVAVALGQQEIDALVTVWQVTEPAVQVSSAGKHTQPRGSLAFLPRLAWRSASDI